MKKHDDAASKAIQEKYMELQLLSNQIKQMQQQLQAIDEQLVDLRGIVQSLEELKAETPGKQMLVPMSGGIFIRGTLNDTEKLIVNVGNGVAVEKSVTDTQDLLRTKVSDTEHMRQEAIGELQQFVSQAHALEHELQEMMGTQRSEDV